MTEPYCHDEGSTTKAGKASDDVLEDQGRELEGMPPKRSKPGAAAITTGCPLCHSYEHAGPDHDSAVELAEAPGEDAGTEQDVSEPDAGSEQDA